LGEGTKEDTQKEILSQNEIRLESRKCIKNVNWTQETCSLRKQWLLSMAESDGDAKQPRYHFLNDGRERGGRRRDSKRERLAYTVCHNAPLIRSRRVFLID